ncbi:lipopolysaccharide-induced tumor necrosis factor-alpha factor homolog [Episyrphus balteatus]|uniref:lipopolysaccharide-induced tumor necrosis factor-alpha factor homolog n=1 Tax=Episyrphus balteatus TaxID=286459 RepID=UPI0024855214|nr:lipopolysaccharide-induced tumor necrosis factor-alpha factor homolog [Episyrphus balteatus]
MGKKMYPQINNKQANLVDAPPSYEQTINQHPYPTAPTAPSTAFIQPPIHTQQPQQQQQPPIILVQTLHPLGPRPCVLVCPSCHQQQKTKVRNESSIKTHIFAGILCFLGFCCCACLPYCMDTCRNTNHYCSNCNAYIGMYKK